MNMTTDPSVAKFNNIYDRNGITAASLSLALSSFAVNYIQSSYLIGTFYPPDIISGLSAYTPAYYSDQPVYDNSTGSIIVSNIVLDKPGAVYFVLSFSRKIMYNKITGHTDINIRPAITPNNDQLLNCKDGYNQSPLQCKRIVMLTGVKYSITFTNISSNSLYMIYYGVAN